MASNPPTALSIEALATSVRLEERVSAMAIEQRTTSLALDETPPNNLILNEQTSTLRLDGD